ncbi:MAG: exodeoxyribonuclease VII large subunit [Clostridia bacterium]|nr:exodeoxyribonuclease VII large subunit [Clostridia bacterium]
MPVSAPQNDGVLSVSQLNQYVKTLLEGDDVLQSVSVRGEISNFSQPKSGHLYFSLKDGDGLIRCVMFRSRAQFVKFPLQDGLSVVARGAVTLYPKNGEYQLYVSALSRDGVGSLYLAYEKLRAKLESEGLFDEERKKPLPQYPKKIGIVTSPTGAAIRDMLRILKRRFPPAEILIVPAAVQGASAPAELADGIRRLNLRDDIDVIIIGRGGGSFEDLFCFNDETLARTVAASKIPVISAVGHETDFTICDFVSDLRAATPSNAAELAVPDRAELLSALYALPTRLARALTRENERRRERLDSLVGRPIFLRPETLTRDRMRDVDALSDRAVSAVRAAYSSKREGFTALAATLTALNPLATLSRGYAIAETPEGRPVVSVGERAVGDPVDVVLPDGKLSTVVRAITPKRQIGTGDGK